MRFVPTGGITPEKLPEYLALPSVLACGGSWLAPREALATGDFATIRKLDRAGGEDLGECAEVVMSDGMPSVAAATVGMGWPNIVDNMLTRLRRESMPPNALTDQSLHVAHGLFEADHDRPGDDAVADVQLAACRRSRRPASRCDR